MNQRTHVLMFIMAAVALILNANALHWSSTVSANSSSWSIYRQSSNISFDLSSTVDGRISPIEYHGRVLPPHYAYYAEVGNNDVRLRERTSALEGFYKSTDEITMRSTVYPNDVDIFVNKPVGSNVYTIEYTGEQWPVLLTASRAIAYSGQQINDRSFEGNNGDFVGSNLLYNRHLSEKQWLVGWLQRMNATVLATNETILRAESEPTKYLGSIIIANTTGMADLRYMLSSPHYDVKHRSYPALSEGDERYYGEYNLVRKIEMRSIFENNTTEYDWLPCCINNWDVLDQPIYGADRIFSPS